MKPIKLKIKTKSQIYSIIIGNNLISKIGKIINNNSINFKKSLLVVDKNIPNNIISKIKKSFIKKEIYTYQFMTSERNKSINNVNKILQ